MHLGTRDDRPGGRAAGVMMRTINAPRSGMALAGRRAEPKVMLWQGVPVRLIEVLAFVGGIGMIRLMDVHGGAPVISGPNNAHAGISRTLGESAKPSE